MGSRIGKGHQTFMSDGSETPTELNELALCSMFKTCCAARFPLGTTVADTSTRPFQAICLRSSDSIIWAYMPSFMSSIPMPKSRVESLGGGQMSFFSSAIGTPIQRGASVRLAHSRMDGRTKPPCLDMTNSAGKDHRDTPTLGSLIR